jgi:hypothetical protein
MIHFHFDISTTASDDYTISEAFQEGLDAHYSDLSRNRVPQSEQALLAFLLAEFASSLQPIVLEQVMIPASPHFGVGFLAGYLQAYLEAQK